MAQGDVHPKKINPVMLAILETQQQDLNPEKRNKTRKAN
jgi:hypothetical protein